MTIDKSLEILELNLKLAGNKMPHDCRDAINLAREALKKVKAVREGKEWVGISPLPGEDPK